MLKSLKLKFTVALTTLLIFSCNDEPDIKIYSTDIIQGKSMKLGKKLKNPYKVSVMKQALENIRKEPHARSNEEIRDLNIRTTTLYIRFLPSNYDQYDILTMDDNNEYYDHPLDYEILEEGDYFHDTSINPENPTWQYAAIEVGRSLPQDVYYEIIDELYVPEDDYEIIENGEIKQIWVPTIEALEEEAFRLTDNTFERVTDIARTMGSTWRPSGNIQLYDDRLLRNMPVIGAKVRARRWFTTHIGITDQNGNFSVDGTFRRPANYSIKWERGEWDIRSGTFGQAYYNGPKREGSWNLTISSGMSRLYAIVHAALYDYYKGNRLGLKSPPTSGAKMKVGVYNSDEDVNGSHCKDCRFAGILPRLKIYANNRTVDEIYATTIHELAHASHWEFRKNNWNETSDKLKESWARGVQWALTRLRYPNYRGGTTIMPNYTQIVVDLIDTQANDFTNNGLNFPLDQVEGYTIRQIEDALRGQSSWNGWRDNIRNSYENTTENNLDALFVNWN
jgi:hypothetical protein